MSYTGELQSTFGSTVYNTLLDIVKRGKVKWFGHVLRAKGTLANTLTLQARRKHKRITTLYKMEHNIIDIPLDQYISHNTRCSRKHNSQFLQIRHSSNTFGNSFFPTTAKEWNALPPDIISSSSTESFQKKLNIYLLDH